MGNHAPSIPDIKWISPEDIELLPSPTPTPPGTV